MPDGHWASGRGSPWTKPGRWRDGSRRGSNPGRHRSRSGAILGTQVRPYLGLDVLARARITAVPDSSARVEDVIKTNIIPALSA
jgi:hypothetical protein